MADRRPVRHPGGEHRIGKVAGVAGAVVGVVAAGAAAGVALHRYVLRRTRDTTADPYVDEPFGRLPYDETRIVTVEGIDVHVEVIEPRERTGPVATVVFVHGYCLDMGTFHFQRKAVAADGRYRVVLYDQPGHGRSGRLPHGEYTLDLLGTVLRGVVAETVPEGPMILVGHSMGGMSIMALAEQTPTFFDHRVAGVVLMSTSAGELESVTLGMPTLFTRFSQQLLPLVSTNRVTTGMLDRARSAAGDLAWLLTRRYGFGTPSPSPSLVSYVERMNSTTSTEVVARYLRTIMEHSRLSALSALRAVPVLVICGEEDLFTPLAHTHEIVRALPDAQLVVVPQGGHVVMLEHADAVDTALLAFLHQVAP